MKGIISDFTFLILDLVTFSRLEILDLSSNKLTGSVPQSIGALSSLKALSLSQNNINGSLPTKGNYIYKSKVNVFIFSCINYLR